MRGGHDFVEDRKMWGHQSLLCVSPPGAWPPTLFLLPPSRHPLLSGLAHALTPRTALLAPPQVSLALPICYLHRLSAACLCPAGQTQLLTLLFLMVSPTHLRIKNRVSHLFVAPHVGVKQALNHLFLE